MIKWINLIQFQLTTQMTRFAENWEISVNLTTKVVCVSATIVQFSWKKPKCEALEIPDLAATTDLDEVGNYSFWVVISTSKCTPFQFLQFHLVRAHSYDTKWDSVCAQFTDVCLLKIKFLNFRVVWLIVSVTQRNQLWIIFQKSKIKDAA